MMSDRMRVEFHRNPVPLEVSYCMNPRGSTEKDLVEDFGQTC